jgi:MoaA/NifB/PqqE/SkfB family radical SAM enzyme
MALETRQQNVAPLTMLEPRGPAAAALELSGRSLLIDKTVTTSDWINGLTDLAGLGTRQIYFYGADLLSRPDLFSILSAARSHFMEVSIFTDVTAETPDIAEELARHGIAGLWLTLYGARPETHDIVAGPGAFRRMFDLVHSLRQQQQSVRLNAALARWDLSALADLVDLASSIECPIASDALRFGRTAEADALPRPSIWVMPDGTIRPCRALGPDVGDLSLESIDAVWRRSQELQRLAGVRVTRGPGCEQCLLRADCFHEPPMDRVRV